ncbi:PEP/pyruvate-binding domain-containing protein [Pseudomonas guariconensis]|uniref:PEP/pyruvate-binding domain-containing protein n=1 Tax=Pseudomonas guariconensis TaxID=1288410 RepID=UPI0018A8B358|nr:PEP/pyruvate-binding domain-containing protein [Pseudomonas guariconensis]MBF8742100.1 hypothetical protein [Pseudomonas guariconensis]MBF8751096.1 hypothetical protein [Pseudomonas guariconensis]
MNNLKEIDANSLPGKFRNMLTLSSEHPVPEMKLITEAELSQWFTNFSAVKQQLLEYEKNISITSGAFLNRDMKNINAALASLIWDEQSFYNVSEFAREISKADGGSIFAVRSACIAEDMQKNSFAGIYDSVLNVRPSGLQDAILTVVKSFYSLRAVIEKRQHGISEAAAVNIIIQRMVEPEFSGVAFSCDPLTGREGLYVEYVSGLGDGLVSGEQEPQLLDKSDELRHRDAWAQIKEIVSSAKMLLGGHVDIEWAYEGGIVWLLQARMVTRNYESDLDKSPRFKLWQLYDDLPTSLLDKIPDWALYFHKKRKPLADIARRYQEISPGAVILEANSSSLSDKECCDLILAEFQSKQVVLDFSDAVRQLIIKKSELIPQLQELMRDTGRTHTVVIRDFIKGEYGLITRSVQTPRGEELIADISSDGLLAMNRGSAVSEIISLDDMSINHVLKQSNINLLKAVTAEALENLGEVQIEWVQANSLLYALDYSPVVESKLTLSQGGRVMSQGFARGRAFVITVTEEIENYSIAPSMSLNEVPDISAYGRLFANIVDEIEQLDAPAIIIAKRPYAALASLMPWASGFIFEKGSLLCHLGVLLREKKLPAICDESLFSNLGHGELYVLDSSHIN